MDFYVISPSTETSFGCMANLVKVIGDFLEGKDLERKSILDRSAKFSYRTNKSPVHYFLKVGWGRWTWNHRMARIKPVALTTGYNSPINWTVTLFTLFLILRQICLFRWRSLTVYVMGDWLTPFAIKLTDLMVTSFATLSALIDLWNTAKTQEPVTPSSSLDRRDILTTSVMYWTFG